MRTLEQIRKEMTENYANQQGEMYASYVMETELDRDYQNSDIDFTNGFLSGAEWEAEREKWIKYNGQEVEEGCYWVVLDNEKHPVQEATVRSKELSKLMRQEGFWQFNDMGPDEKVNPIYYQPIIIPSPPKTSKH